VPGPAARLQAPREEVSRVVNFGAFPHSGDRSLESHAPAPPAGRPPGPSLRGVRWVAAGIPARTSAVLPNKALQLTRRHPGVCQGYQPAGGRSGGRFAGRPPDVSSRFTGGAQLSARSVRVRHEVVPVAVMTAIESYSRGGRRT
jgi:hypothetical protein